MVGMRDVAKAAGVSLSTVSLVVNNTGYVSDDMRAKVESAMHQLNYIPNELARNLYRNRTNTVGIILPTIAHPFFATLTAHLQREFAVRGLKTLLCSIADAGKGEAEYVNMLQRRMMDGIVMAAHTEHPANYWTSINRPVVAFDRALGANVPTVRSDHEHGGRLIAEQLIRTGTRHAVLIGGPRSQFTDGTTFPTIRYHLTVEKLLAEAGIRCDYVEAGTVANIAEHEAVARAIFERYPDVDAIVGSDIVAAVALQEATRRGKDVPADVQVIAYDGTLMAETAGLRLSCVKQDFAAIAAALAALLDGQIDGEKAASNGGGKNASRSDAGAARDGHDDRGETGATVSAVAGSMISGTAGNIEEVIPVAFIPAETTR